MENAQQSDIIAPGWHVDYWDYIGWEDVFAHLAVSERQKAYARALNERMFYTLQFIGKWAESSVAGQRAEAAAVIQKYAQLTPGADLSNGRVGASHEITLQNTYYSGTYDAHLVSVSPLKFVDIYCGENVWWRLDYAYIVTEWHNLGRWDGLWRLRSKLGYWGQGVMLFWYNIRIMVRLSSPIG